MNKISKIIVPVAMAAVTLVACQKEVDNPRTDVQGTRQITVKATPDALKGDATKTYIDSEKKIIWGTGEFMKLAVTAGESTVFADSNSDPDEWDGHDQAYFGFIVPEITGSGFLYQGLYPASAAETSDNTNPASYKVNLPAIQNATDSSYDPAAYIMIAKPESFPALQNEWTTSFRRGTALNKITLKNFASSVEINKVKITAEGKKLAGGRHFNLTTGEGLEVYGTDASIDVLYATPLTGTSMDVWFTSWDTEIAEGEKLTIVAYTTDSKSYTKEITVPAGKTIKFQEGYLNNTGVSMSGINPVDVTSLAGDYVILAKHNTSYYALKGEASGTRIASVDYTGSTTAYEGVASIIWTITPSGNAYTIKNGDNYIGWNGGTGSAANNAVLIPEADYVNGKCQMKIDESEGIYHISVFGEPTRILAKNTGAEFFAFYASTGQYSDIVLVPATAMEQVAIPTFSPAAGEVASGTEVTISCATSGATIHYTVDGTDPTSSSATYSSPIAITAATTIKAIAVKEGMADSEIATATYTIPGAGSDWELVSDFSTIDDGGEYIFVNVQNSTSYYMNTATCNQGGGTGCVALTILPTESGFVASDNMILVLSGSADGFVASNKEGKQLKIGATNNGLAINADSGTSLTFYTDENVSGYTLKGNDTNNVVRYIGMNSTTNFRCYNSVNNNVKTGEYVWYHHVGSVSSVTWNLNSIEITTPPTKTTYTAGQSFDPAGMVVTGHFVDADDANNTKDEEVTEYTISPDGALSETDDHVTITYQGKTTTQAITVNAISGTSQTVTYTVTSKTAVSTNGTAPSGSSATYSQTANNVAAGQIPANHSITLTLSGYDGKTITGASVSMKSNKSAGAGSLSLESGNSTIAFIAGSNFNSTNWYDAWSTSYVSIPLAVTETTIDDNATIVLTISASANSLYFESLTLTYKESESGGGAGGEEPAATVTTGAASNIAQTTAVLNGSYSGASGRVDYAGFLWGTSSGSVTTELYADSSASPFSATLSGLQPNTTYYYRAFVDEYNENTGSYERRLGEVKSFTTLPSSTSGDRGYLDCYEVPVISNLSGSQNTGLSSGRDDKWYSYNTSNSSQKVVTHTFTGDSRVRNYTVLFDRDKHAPLWAAFPMHANVYGGSTSRSDSWTYDPAVTNSWQQTGLDNAQSVGYSRGHFVASSYRKRNDASNLQTFYYTNQAPQWQSGFNSGVWSSLEERVLAMSPSSQNDTLYVVVGVLYEGSASTLPSDGVNIPLPSHFYTCLMKCTFTSGTVTATQGIAFVYSNESHTGKKYYDSSFVTSIDAIEQRTGFEFFPNVPFSLQSSAEANSNHTWFTGQQSSNNISGVSDSNWGTL